MQAYAKAELAPAEQDRGDAKAAPEVPVEQTRSLPGTSSPLAALVLDELDETALGVLATRLMPHLPRLEERDPAVVHVA